MDSVISPARRASGDRDGFRLSISGGAHAAGKARREISRLRSDLDPPLLESVRLLVTELVTNSVRHAHAGTVELAVLVGAERVRVEIANPGSAFEPALRGNDLGEDPSSAEGWGLFLVDRISDSWGIVGEDEGTQRVWFEIQRTA